MRLREWTARSAGFTSRLLQHAVGLQVSILTVGDPQSWAWRRNAPPRWLFRNENFLCEVNTFPSCKKIAEVFAELRQAFDDIGDDFDLCRDDIDFTDDGAVVCGEVELLPPGTIDSKQQAGYL